MAETNQIRAGRAYYSKDVKEIYDALTIGDDQEQSPFETNKDVFMLAACLGFKNGRKRELSSGGRFDIRLEVFSEQDQDILKAIALAATGDIKTLEQDLAFLDIVEQYAHGGILDVKALLLDRPGMALWNLVELL